MALLLSNYPPAKTQCSLFNETFLECFQKAESLDIAVGYVSEKALNYLAEIIHKNGRPFCNLIIGMHYFDKFTYSQYASAKEIETFFSDNNLGAVHLVTSFPYHGKVYYFNLEGGKNISIVGSSNLTNIVAHKPIRQYELDVLIEDNQMNLDILNFINKLKQTSPKLSSPNLKIKKFRKVDNLMEGLSYVKSVPEKDVASFKSKLLFKKSIEIPITTADKSNINACFGKGRENKARGITLQRPWYEVELIVPKNITDLKHYPKSKEQGEHKTIEVLTDDGYVFNCSIGGQNNKNFRSEGDLKILGRWLKGQLENSGLLLVGQKVTDEILYKYGRSSITLTPSSIKNKWFLDFSVDRSD